MKNGVDAAKAIALGADLAGYGRMLLSGAAKRTDYTSELHAQMEQVEFELRTAMFGIGCRTIQELRSTDRLLEQ